MGIALYSKRGDKKISGRRIIVGFKQLIKNYARKEEMLFI